MTYQEEINALRDKISKYEELLEKVMDGPFMESTIISQHNGLYRVMVNGNEIIIPKSPKLTENPKTGDKVMVNKNMIICILPEELEKPVKPVEFERIKWEQIGGLKSQISQIKDAIELPIKHPDYLKRMGLEPSRGVLLYGPPGCGKTMVAKAIASAFLDGTELNPDSFIYLKGGEMLSPYVGVTENNIKSIFSRARQNYKVRKQRSVIFIDEAEAVLNTRGSRRSSDVDLTIVPTFLSELDGFESNSTFIILATNFKDALDPAIIRPGRIDLRLEISRPTVEDAEDIFKIYLKGKPVSGNVDRLAKTISEEAYNRFNGKLSGALIKGIVDKASYSIIREINGKLSESILTKIIKTWE
ncbi:MAG: AAA family ATPase [Inconstantimicrobium porci]|uniref:ATP-binding protein n=1 Tax=Inconstantimicrobium porci TaxID=2652291 RepID=UPI002A916784|nr:AAA family ATPase [Inconstantimicrobium porci]MDY5911887.1 AAA family ATPase [Inconstantimicrobium porci]